MGKCDVRCNEKDHAGFWKRDYYTQTNIGVPVGFRICQLTFEYVGETLKEYHGKYGKANHEWTPEDMLPKPYFDWDYELYRTDKGK